MSDGAGDGRPSRSTRFRKGQSGNPGGRPKKKPEKSVSAFDIVIDRKLTIIQGGEPREVTVEEALQHKTYQDAIAGNRAARREVLKMIAKREKAITERAPRINPVTVTMDEPGPHNADEAMLILGIARQDTGGTEPHEGHVRLLLEPWAVEAANGRRGRRRLDKQAPVAAQQCTRDPETLRSSKAEEA